MLDRPFLSIDEQVAKLRTRGLIVDPEDWSILVRDNYYCVVNGYKDPFIDSVAKQNAQGDDRYVVGASLHELHSVLSFDRSLKMVLFRHILQAEALLKSIVSHVFTGAYSGSLDCYLDEKCYNSKPELNYKVVRLIRDLEDSLSGTTSSYIDHYRKRREGLVPLWVAINALTFGTLCEMYSLMKPNHRTRIAKEVTRLNDAMGMKNNRIEPERLDRDYDVIRQFRNICAHDERLYCAKVGRSKDIGIATVVQKLSNYSLCDNKGLLVREIGPLLEQLAEDLTSISVSAIVHRMGFQDLYSLNSPS